MVKRIGFFVISTHLGGAERSLLDYLITLQRQSPCDFLVVLPKAVGPLIDELKKNNIHYQVLAIPNLLFKLSRQTPLLTLMTGFMAIFQLAYYLPRLVLFINRQNFTVIHTTGLKHHLLLGIVKNFFRARLVIHLRDIINNRLLIRFFQHLSRNSAVRLVANSRATAATMAPVEPLVIYNGFDEKLFNPIRNPTWREYLKIPQDGLLVGVVGAIARWKGQREFVETAIELCRDDDHAYFVVVGSEIYDTLSNQGERQKLMEMVRAARLEDRILFLEFQKDVASVYQALDIFVHCSISPEPFGRVVVEAMLCGVAVVAADGGGPKEIISDGHNGVLYRQGDRQQMKAAIARLLAGPQLRQRLMSQAPKIIGQFSMGNYQTQMSRILGIN